MRPRAFPERERRRFTRYRIASAPLECVFSLQDGGRVLGRASDGAIFKLWTSVDTWISSPGSSASFCRGNRSWGGASEWPPFEPGLRLGHASLATAAGAAEGALPA